jgi:hypothetical protein
MGTHKPDRCTLLAKKSYFQVPENLDNFFLHAKDTHMYVCVKVHTENRPFCSLGKNDKFSNKMHEEALKFLNVM